ncbi:putative reverse transcriptase domain-containing protein [Tanacetum coccineum]
MEADEGFLGRNSINKQHLGSGPDWLFDIDLLTNSMNYEPVTIGNQTNRNCRRKVRATSTNIVSTVSPSVSAAGQSFDNADDLPTDPLMPDLEDTADLLNTGIFSGDLNNLEKTMNVSPIPTTIIHKDHPKDQIIGDINSATQTRRMTKISEAHALIEAMQDELLQFRLQKVWRLVDLPKGKHAIGTKWVNRNKKDERGIVVRNKTRLVTQEEVYVCQPLGFEDPQFPNKVYKVEKALYGLHQALRAWYETLSTYLLENGFRRGTIDKNLFIKKDKGDILVVQVYVNDIIFSKKKDMESHQPRKRKEAERCFYYNISMIGSLMYLTASRPKIMFAICACARFQVTPKVSHIHVVKRIFRYLKGQPKLGLWYPRDSSFDLEAFSDSVYAEEQVPAVATSHPQKTQTPRLTKRGRDTEIPQSVGPPKKVGNEVVHKELGDRVERAAITAASLDAEQDSGGSPRCQEAMGGTIAHTRSERVPTPSYNSPLLGGNTPRSDEERLEHQDDLTDFVPPTPHDSPLSGGYTPGSDEGRPNINELMAICTNLLNRVLALETSKTAQDLVINKLKMKVKRILKRT